jgi:hypothetical protein
VPSRGAVECRGTLGAITVEDVVVPANARCVLQGTTVTNNVSVGTGATLLASGVAVGGNVQADGAANVVLRDLNGRRSTVGGDVSVQDGGRATIARTNVENNVQAQQNAGPLLIAENRVGGSMQVDQNTGGVRIVRNRIAQTLQCQANTPPPMGGGNVAGEKQDQCAAL